MKTALIKRNGLPMSFRNQDVSVVNPGTQEPTLASVWEALAGSRITDEFLNWPADLFALTHVILDRIGYWASPRPASAGVLRPRRAVQLTDAQNNVGTKVWLGLAGAAEVVKASLMTLTLTLTESHWSMRERRSVLWHIERWDNPR